VRVASGFIQLAAHGSAGFAGFHSYFVRHLAGFARRRIGLTMLFFCRWARTAGTQYSQDRRRCNQPKPCTHGYLMKKCGQK
jgi:hypothetical protein